MKEAVVYVYLQHDLPTCFWPSLKKTREMWGGDIYLVAPRREESHPGIEKYSVKFVSCDSVPSASSGGFMTTNADGSHAKDPLIAKYEAVSFFEALYPGWDGFWDNACKRFFFLYLLQKMYNIDRIIHLETDVVPYVPIRKMFDKFSELYGGKLVFSPHASEQLSCCFMYCDSVAILGAFCDEVLKYFGLGRGHFATLYPQQTILNETNFAYTFMMENQSLVGLFPTMPDEPLASELGFLIDSTSWGMWVNGLQRNFFPRYAAATHNIGKRLLAGEFGIHFEFNGEKLAMPWVHNKLTNQSTPLATLHFNSKKLEKWI